MEFRVEKENLESGATYQIHFDTDEIVDNCCLGFSLYPLSEKDLLKLKEKIDKALKEEKRNE